MKFALGRISLFVFELWTNFTSRRTFVRLRVTLRFGLLITNNFSYPFVLGCKKLSVPFKGLNVLWMFCNLKFGKRWLICWNPYVRAYGFLFWLWTINKPHPRSIDIQLRVTLRFGLLFCNNKTACSRLTARHLSS